MKQKEEMYTKYKKKLLNIQAYSKQYMQTFTNKPYHNYSHADEMAAQAIDLGLIEGLKNEELFLLATAGMMHDIYNTAGNPQIEQTESDEKISGDIAYTITKSFGYNEYQAKTVARLIYATEISTEPKDILEKIMRDADVDNFGKETFFENSEKVRKELHIPQSSSWKKGLYKLLTAHTWFTEAATKLLDEQKQRNINYASQFI